MLTIVPSITMTHTERQSSASASGRCGAAEAALFTGRAKRRCGFVASVAREGKDFQHAAKTRLCGAQDEAVVREALLLAVLLTECLDHAKRGENLLDDRQSRALDLRQLVPGPPTTTPLPGSLSAT